MGEQDRWRLVRNREVMGQCCKGTVVPRYGSTSLRLIWIVSFRQ